MNIIPGEVSLKSLYVCGKYILANPDYHFSMTHHAAAAFWYNNDLYKNNDLGGNLASEFLNALMDKAILLIEPGKKLYEEKQKANTFS